MLEKYNKMISYAIQPIRIVGLISMLWQFFNGDAISDPSPMFFNYFIPLYLSSFVIEVILTSMRGLRGGLVSLSTKFVQLLPIEFAGVAGFALLTFAPHTANTLLMAIRLSLVILVCETGIEGYHRFIAPHLNRIKLTPQMTTLTVIGMTLFTFFTGFYFLVLSEHRLVFIQ